MRDIPATIASTWKDGLFVGDRRPIVRATVVHPRMYLRRYPMSTTFFEDDQSDISTGDISTSYDPTRHRKVNQCYADFQFTKLHTPKELPNIKSVDWTRSIDADVAECTITCWNTKQLDIGEVPEPDTLDYPGYYTYSRGGSSFSKRWKQTKNEWFGMLMPDNIIRTYQGYGFDASLAPELDPHLVATGVWMIDSVEMTDAGLMTIKCRDIGRLLLDQIYFGPVVPDDFYNHDFQNWSGVFPHTTTGKLKVTPDGSSNQFWVASDSVNGHKVSYAFDGNPSSYWVSIGNVAPSRRFAYEWVQCTVGNKSVNSVKIRTKKKGYTYYISVKVGGTWQGAAKINYHDDMIGRNHADINYVASGNVDSEKFIDIKLPQAYKNVQAVRVTLGNLQDFHFGTYQYRAGIRDVEVYGSTTTKVGFTVGPAGSNPGRYSDYTDIIKLLCAWGGFFWPEKAKYRYSNGDEYAIYPKKFDTKVLGKGVRGRVFGYFQDTGTSGPIPLSHSNFDKKSLMDCISYIRDILGYIFFIDETGGVQWRLPNVFNFGCLADDTSLHQGYRPRYAHQIDEESVLLTLSCSIDAKNVRESYFVGDAAGIVGAYAPGFNPNPTGIRRMAGWTDQNFAPAVDKNGKSTKAQITFARDQCTMMADMLSLRQLFTYRTDRVRIPANPAIQIDDQVQIFERTTAEGYRHYVKGISSSLDMSTGEWTYDLDTHWLGESPDAQWLFKTDDLSAVTAAYIRSQIKRALATEAAAIRAATTEALG